MMDDDVNPLNQSDIELPAEQDEHDESATVSGGSPEGDTSRRPGFATSKYPRGGLPKPPSYDGALGKDMKAFDRYQRKVEIWLAIAKHIVPPQERAPRLLQELHDDALLVTEDIPVTVFETITGVDNLLRILANAFDGKRRSKLSIAMKNYFDDLTLAPGERTTSHIIRSAKACRELSQYGILMPEEVRVHYLFKSLRVGDALKAQILTAAGGEYSWKAVTEAIQLLYPEHMPYDRPSFAKGKGKGHYQTMEAGMYHEGEEDWSPPPMDVNQARSENTLGVEPDVAEQVPEPSGEPADDEPQELSTEVLAAQVNYKAARQRLTNAVQARGFYQDSASKKKNEQARGAARRPGETIAEVKARTTCSRCGRYGHWQGDAECPMSGKGSGKNGAQVVPGGEVLIADAMASYQVGVANIDYTNRRRASPEPHDAGNDLFGNDLSFSPVTAGHTSRALVTTSSQSTNPDQDSDVSSFFLIYMAQLSVDDDLYVKYFSVMTACLPETQKYMIIDTGCQMSVSGSEWQQARSVELAKKNLRMRRYPEHKGFTFGPGKTKISSSRARIPAGIMGACVELRSSTIDGPLPFLSSKGMQAAFGLVLDAERGTACFRNLGVPEVRLCEISNGHFGIPLDDFPDWIFPKSADSVPESHHEVVILTRALPQHVQRHRERYRTTANETSGSRQISPSREDPSPLEHAALRTQVGQQEYVGNHRPPQGAPAEMATNRQEGPLLDLPLRPDGRVAERERDHLGPLPWNRDGCQRFDIADERPTEEECSERRVPATAGELPTQSAEGREGVHRGTVGTLPRMSSVRQEVEEVRQPLDPIGPATGPECKSAAHAHPPARAHQTFVFCVLAAMASILGIKDLGSESITRLLPGRPQGPCSEPAVYDPASRGIHAAPGPSDAAEPRASPAHPGSTDHADALTTASANVIGADTREDVGGSPLASRGGPHGRRGRAHERTEREHRMGDTSTSVEHAPEPDDTVGARGLSSGPGTTRGGGHLKKGQLMRLAHRARKVADSLIFEGRCYDIQFARRQTAAQGRECDVVEVFCGVATITRRAHLHGLVAGEPADLLLNGWDFRLADHRNLYLDYIRRARPRLVIVSFPCTKWCRFANLNYYWRRDELHALRQQEMCFLQFCDAIFEEQLSRGDHALCEQPLGTEAYSQEPITRLLNRNGVRRFQGDMCRYNKRNTDGVLIKKSSDFIGTHEFLERELSLKCSPEHRHDHPHAKVEGKETKVSGEYSSGFADAVLRAALDIRGEQEYGSNILVYMMDGLELDADVYMTDADTNIDTWRPLLNDAADLLAKRSVPMIMPELESAFGRKVTSLVPWTLRQIQIARVPKAKRWNSMDPDTHRLTALLFNDGSIRVEAERIADGAALRERFTKPVSLGVFVFGNSSLTRQQERERDEPSAPEPAPTVFRHSDDIWFEGGSTSKEMRSLVARMHNNMGHPETNTMVRTFIEAGASDEAITTARALRCGACLRTRQPHLARPARVPRVGTFNEVVGIDILFITNCRGKKFMYQSVLDMSGKMHIAVLVTSRESEHLLYWFRMAWMLWAGPPKAVYCDKDGGYGGVFHDTLLQMGIDLKPIPAEAHWQAGVVERHQQTWKYMAQTTINAMQIETEEEMTSLAVEVNHAKNTTTRQAGYSAAMWTFGREIDLPSGLLSNPNGIPGRALLSEAAEYGRRSLMRLEATKAFHDYEVSVAVKRAMMRQSRPYRGDFEPGAKVLYRREQFRTRKGKVVPENWLPGTVIGPDILSPGDEARGLASNVWIVSGGRPILVAKEHLQPAHPFLAWSPARDDIDEIQRLSKQIQHELKHQPADLPEAEPVPRTDTGVELAPDASVGPFVRQAPQEPEATTEPLPRASGPPVALGPDDPSTRTDEPRRLTRAEPSVPEPPTTGRDEEPMIQDANDDTNAPRDDEPAERTIGALKRGPEGSPELFNSPPPSIFPDHEPDHPLMSTPTKMAKRLDHRFGETSEELFFVGQADKDEHTGNAFRIQRAGGPAKLTNDGFQTRAQAKQIDREIPWRLIPHFERPLYEQALAKEWNDWLKFEAVLVLDEEASRSVIATVPADHILTTRVCYKNRNAGKVGLPTDAKARIVAHGYKASNVVSADGTPLRRDSPTASRVGVLLLMQVSASLRLRLWCADASSSFMQGENTDASIILYLHQPQGGLPGLRPGQLLKVRKGVYGLMDAPRGWWLALKKVLLKLGFRQLALDRALFVYRSGQRLIAILAVHVDDILIGIEDSPQGNRLLETLWSSLVWGKKRQDSFTYCGRHIVRKPDGTIELDQKDFCDAIQITTVPRWRSSTPDAELTDQEKTELKSAQGILNWLSGISRPGLAAATSLSQRATPKISDLLEANRTLRTARASPDAKITFRPIDILTSVILGYGDSSFANVDDIRSQAGMLILIAERAVLTTSGGMASLIEWRSHRIKRVCRSTLAAETQACGAAVDAALYLRALSAEILLHDYSPGRDGPPNPKFMPCVIITDCRSLYDLLIREGSLTTITEKRLAIDLACMIDMVEELQVDDPRELFKWVPTTEMWADYLTKVMPENALRAVLDRGWFRLARPRNG